MKKLLLLLLSLVLMTPMLVGCSKDSEEKNQAASALIGKWQLVWNGAGDVVDSKKFLIFTSNNKLIVDQPSEVVETMYYISNDWSVLDNNALKGYIFFDKGFTFNNYFLTISSDRNFISLYPNTPDISYVMSPGVKYARVTDGK